MKKLELKHLAPYLPYRLNSQYFLSDVIVLSKGQPEEKRVKRLASNSVEFVLKNCKPILKPLGDLFAKRFNEINGGLRDIDIVSDKIFFNNHIDDETTHESFWNKLINSQIYPTLNQSKLLLNFLYENHYDVEALLNHGEGLIEQNLAIDINTLEKYYETRRQ